MDKKLLIKKIVLIRDSLTKMAIRERKSFVHINDVNEFCDTIVDDLKECEKGCEYCKGYEWEFECYMHNKRNGNITSAKNYCPMCGSKLGE